MSDMYRERRTGGFYKRAAKFLKGDAVEEADPQAGPSRNVPIEAIVELPGLVDSQEPLPVDPEQPLLQEPEQQIPEDLGDAERIVLDDTNSFSDDSGEEGSNEWTFQSMSIVDCIRYWALSNNETHRSINMILQIFKKFGAKVPLTAKTLLQTKRNASNEIAELGGGQFWYNGFKKTLSNYFRLDAPPTVDQFTLTLSIDGLPLHRSGALQFWPVLFAIDELPAAPVMTAAIYCGVTKPTSVEQYLRPVVNELNGLIRVGMFINGKHITVKIRAIVADTPARAFIKGVVGHTGYWSCQKCTAKGEYSRQRKTMVFPFEIAPKRTNLGFRTNEPAGHRKHDTPLIELAGFDIVEDVPVGDRLHILDLGNSRRLMMGWRDGVLSATKWRKPQWDSISFALQRTAQPCEVHRKLRHIKHLGYWKGSEYAFFFHYCSFIVLQEHISTPEYRHFMLLFCAMTLLSANAHRAKWPLAGQMLEQFVKDYETVYGVGYMTSNVHNLLHVHDEVVRFGSLSAISTYRFENELQHLKRLVRSGWKNLEQAINRISEFENFCMPKPPEHTITYPSQQTKFVTKVFVRPRFTLQTSWPNAWFLTSDGTIGKLQSASDGTGVNVGKVYVRGRKLDRKMLAFDGPMVSSGMLIYKGYTRDLSNEADLLCATDEIVCKFVVTTSRDKQQLTFVPLLHTIRDD
ncbi:uncharacterized protein LOC128299515 [Anopheles moucheti]|uniref:uncharacterized protein LOC128299515 n=1 Tax=Anopheles moucheti TaxID=186751 RepID=UPI0022F071EE|nr:uncharacterized protein LOC128299515 [Anopheles moucheti]